jgi:hypothetical protein
VKQGYILEQEVGKSIILNELDDASKAFVMMAISQRCEELRLYNMV